VAAPVTPMAASAIVRRGFVVVRPADRNVVFSLDHEIAIGVHPTAPARRKRVRSPGGGNVPRSILVSAGHGGGDPGAQGYGHSEAALALELRDLVYERLQRAGHTALRDGAGGENESLRRAIVRARGAGVALEIHYNAAIPTATGVEAFGTDETRQLCVRLSAAVASVLGIPVRGGAGGFKHHTTTRHGTLGFCRAGGVLIEVCFMNQRDLDRYLPRKAQVAQALADVLSMEANTGLAAAARSVVAPTRPRRGVAPGTASVRRRSRSAPQRRAGR
jgi:N-acetylmuramoyl-L-alanine amidase